MYHSNNRILILLVKPDLRERGALDQNFHRASTWEQCVKCINWAKPDKENQRPI